MQTRIILLLVVNVLASFAAISKVSAAIEQDGPTNLATSLRDDTPSWFSCELPFTSIYPTILQISIHVMTFVQANDGSTSINGKTENQTSLIGTSDGDFVLTRLDFNSTRETLNAAGLNSSLPFVFFINGFLAVDGDGHINGTWMYGVAKSYARRKMRNQMNGEDRKNVVFITWSLPSVWSNNPLNLIPAYLKTMAYYNRILNFVADTIRTMTNFVEQGRDGQWESVEARRKFYKRFQFYGHSLGAHLITDAVLKVHDSMSEVKFGKLTGLDPANPCFLSLEHGLSVKRMAEAVDQLVVVHSNAGFAGLTSERADMEIVLNGGTFQPGCSWYDLSCSHGRVVDTLRYIDDQCQMVAYKCTDYQHFKMGACETCESYPSNDYWAEDDIRQSDAIRNRTSPNCVLVNLPEQHQDSEQILAIISNTTDQDGDGRDDNDHIRRLADDDDDAEVGGGSADGKSHGSPSVDLISKPNSDSHELVGKYPRRDKRTIRELREQVFSATSSSQLASRENTTSEQPKRYNHYVNTNPNFRTGRKTHCLEHYQLRLLVNYQDDEIKRKCPIESFVRSRGGKFHLRLSDEKINWDNSEDIDDSLTPASFDEVIENALYTSLLNFVGRPKLFVSAVIDNIDTSKLARCLKDYDDAAIGNDNQKPSTSGVKFVLDIAFMSHVNKKVRHAFSSILCGQWSSISGDEKSLALNLCHQDELTNVSGKLDELIDSIKNQPFYESWKLSLLNNLFSLFAQWEPF